MSEAHARLGPSNHRWPHCPGSVREEAKYVDVAGDAAIDGTGSHLLLESCLIHNVRAEAYDGQIIGAGHRDKPNGWMVYPDRIERVQMCLDYVARRVRELGEKYPDCDVEVIPERKVHPGKQHTDPSKHRDDWWGTADITIRVVEKGPLKSIRFVEVCDYKDGRGWVKEKDNTQLISYGIGAAVGVTPRPVPLPVRLSVVQPRTSPPVRYDDVDDGYLMDQLEVLTVAAFATDDPEAPLIPGKHCAWCKANPKRGGHCGAAAEKSVTEVRQMTDVIATDGDLLGMFAVDMASLPAESLSKLLDAEDGILAGFAKAKSEVERRLNAGEKVPGFAFGHGRASNVWADAEEAEKKLKGARLKADEYAPRSLISPAQMKKLPNLTDKQKQRLWDDLVVTKAGPEKLIRVAYGEETDAQDMFKDVIEGGAATANAASLFSDPTPEPETKQPEPPVSFL